MGRNTSVIQINEIYELKKKNRKVQKLKFCFRCVKRNRRKNGPTLSVFYKRIKFLLFHLSIYLFLSLFIYLSIYLFIY